MARTHSALLSAMLIFVLLALALLGASGCSKGSGRTGSAVATDVPPPAVQPPPPMTREPKASVYSYLLWISYAYRIADSDVATAAFDPWEEVRVNSYVQYNKQEGRALDQKLVTFKDKPAITKGATATVSVEEGWSYRYIDMKTGRYKSPEYKATYDSTYTVVRQKDGRWLVHRVEAKPRGEVK